MLLLREDGKGRDFFAIDPSLSLMSFFGVENAIRHLISHAGNRNDLTLCRTPHSACISPLSWAVVGRHQQAVRILLEAGFSNDAKTVEFDPLCEAIEHDLNGIANFLVDHDCMPQNGARYSVAPLTIAVERRNQELIHKLIGHGVSPYCTPTQDEQSYLESLLVPPHSPLLTTIGKKNPQMPLEMLQNGTKNGASDYEISTTRRIMLMRMIKLASFGSLLPYEDVICYLLEEGVALDVFETPTAAEDTEIWISDETPTPERLRDLRFCIRRAEPIVRSKLRLDTILEPDRLKSILNKISRLPEPKTDAGVSEGLHSSLSLDEFPFAQRYARIEPLPSPSPV